MEFTHLEDADEHLSSLVATAGSTDSLHNVGSGASVTSDEASSGDVLSDGGPSSLPSTMSGAINGLKQKALYTAVVTRFYRWASSPYGDFILRVSSCLEIFHHVNRSHKRTTCLLIVWKYNYLHINYDSTVLFSFEGG